MSKNAAPIIPILWFCTMTGLIVCVFSPALREHYKHKHDHFKPIKGVGRIEDSICYSIHDSLLDARKARYDSLVQDYKYACDRIFDRWPIVLSGPRDFTREKVSPKYAKQIGVKNLNQYSKYINNFARDSLVPAYRDVYKNKVLPFVRNNTRTR